MGGLAVGGEVGDCYLEDVVAGGEVGAEGDGSADAGFAFVVEAAGVEAGRRGVDDGFVVVKDARLCLELGPGLVVEL